MFTTAHSGADLCCINFSFTADLIAFEVGPSAGSEALFTAEALQL